METDLAAQAAANLAAYRNVTVHSNDGALLDPGPCDAMLINAGVTHPHPLWLSRLNEAGRLVLPITTSMAPSLGKGFMLKITRRQSLFAAQVVSLVAIYSSPSVRDPALEPLLLKAFDSRDLLKIKSLRTETHNSEETCLVHTPAICFSAKPVKN